MSRTRQMQIRIEPELKTEAEAILSRLGLKSTEYICMALSRLVLRKGLPFDACIPNSDTVAALEEPACNLRQFDSTREVFADLEARSNLKEALELFFEYASTEEINRRLHDEVFTTKNCVPEHRCPLSGNQNYPGCCLSKRATRTVFRKPGRRQTARFST